MNWREVTALFGGTFDPPHYGHQQAAAGLFQEPGIKKLILLPNGTPPQKKTLITPAHHRIEMLKLCMQDVPYQWSIDPCETQLSTPSYTLHTLRKFTSQDPQLAFVIGADQLLNLENWYGFPEVFQLCHWIILARQPNGWKSCRDQLLRFQSLGLVTLQSETPERILFSISNSRYFGYLSQTPAIECSSSLVRQRLQLPEANVSQLIPPQVEEYLMHHRLYGTEKTL